MKPKTEWCRRAALMKWKGWDSRQVSKLVEQGLLKIKRYKPLSHNPKAKKKQKLGRCYFHVPSAEEL